MHNLRKERWKKEGYFTPIENEDRPLCTYHVDHLRPMEQSAKSYAYLFIVVDAFSKFLLAIPNQNYHTKLRYLVIQTVLNTS